MSNDKFEATFHDDGEPLPQRSPGAFRPIGGWSERDLGIMAGWDRTGSPPVRDESAGPDRPMLSPGTPPWVPAGPAAGKTGIPLWGWISILAMLSIFALCAVTVISGADAPRPPAVSKDVKPAPTADKVAEATYAVGKTFRSGDFDYTIHAVKRGVDQVGPQFAREKAQGVFTRLDVTVRNVSTEPAWFDADLRIRVEDAAGREFGSASSANIMGNDQENGWMTKINPGNAIRAFVFFDLPKTTAADRAVVSAGMLAFEADAVVPLP